MPPNVLPQAQGSGFASIQQGLAAVQQLGQFLEQKRQFEEDQARLNRVQDANWSWNMMLEVAKTTDAQSLKDVAAKYPSMLSMILQKGMGVDEATAMPWVTALANAPYNALESFNYAHTILNRHGSGEAEGKDILSQSVAEMTKATQTMNPTTTAGGTQKGPATAPLPQRATLSMTPLKKTEGVPAEDPALTEFKSKVFSLASNVKDAKFGMDAQQRSELDRLVGEYRTKSPQVEEFVNKDMSAFIGTAMGAKGTLASDQLSAGKTVAQPPSPNFPPYMQPSGSEAASQFLRPKETPSPTEEGAAPSPAQPQRPVTATEVSAPMDDFLASITDGEARGQVVLKQKRLEKVLTPIVAAQLEASPGGIDSLIQNANAIISDPQNARAMALSQNAPSVYATDLAGSGSTTMSRLELATKLKQFEKLGLEVEKAKIDLAKAGIEGNDAQAKAIASGVMASMIQSGLVPPPEAATQMNALSDDLVVLREKYNTAKDDSTKQFLKDQIEQKNTQFQGIVAAWKSAVGKANTPEALKAQKLLDAVFDPKNKSGWQSFWNIGKENVQNWTTKKTEETKAPAMTGAGAALGSAYGLE